MKIIKFFILILAFTSLGAVAQITNDFELGDSKTYNADCWVFLGTDLSDAAYAINGSFSLMTNQMSSMPNQQAPHRLTSPWIDMSLGNLSFTTALDVLNGGGKYLDVVLIDEYDNETTILQHTFINAAPQNFSIPVNVSGIYKAEFRFYGDAGTSKGLLDDLSIPGIYAADPSNNCEVLQTTSDTDNDGVADIDDDYPNDPDKAYNNYTPSANTFNTLAYEDLWPSQGDYDFNDLVLDYRFNEITNANNNVVEIEAALKVRAVGGSLDNGFAIQFDNLTPSDITSVTGQEITGSLFSIAANGTENGQAKAVVPVFDTPENVIHRVGGSMFNTVPTNGRGSSDLINIVITLNTPQTSVGTAPYNPFLIKNQVRGVEIHLADKQPSSLVDMSLLGTNQDDTNPGVGKYYKTKNNLPWALDIDTTFEYPIEGTDIINAYLNFLDWAQSNGNSFTDWYTNKENGYRNNSKIYSN
jgi:LruC domain-containing protein